MTLAWQSTDALDGIAREALAALDAGRQIVPFSERHRDFDLQKAYEVTARLRALRSARGEKPVGRKVGFTNRIMWAEYGVYAPVWGDMFDTTVHDLADVAAQGGFALGGLPEPRIEPEIVFKLAAAPRPDMDDAALLDCMEWVAHGFEVVQSIYPGWRFQAADTVADFGLHGALLIGPRLAVAALDRADWVRRLASFEIALMREALPADLGTARNVLDGPLSAIRHLTRLLAQDGANPPLAAGEIVTTGTLTRAMPVAAGERWHTEVDGLALPGIAVRFA